MKIKKIITIIIAIAIIANFTTTKGISEPPEITAEAAILLESSNEKTIYSKNETQKMYPASTTKILTAIIAIENCNLQDTVIIPNQAISILPEGYSVAPLQEGEQFTIEQLIQVMLVYSANDAANAIAYHISGSIENFAKIMNNKIEELGLKNTHFTNPSGMHDENHYTTAYDLAIIMKYCMKNPTFKKLSKIKNCTLPSTDKYEERTFITTNELIEPQSIYYYKYAIAGKTGYTSQAQNCLVSVADKDGLELICVILSVGIYPNNLSAKFIETKSLFDYGYSNYTISKICEQNTIGTQIEIINATKETKKLDLIISEDIYALISQKDLENGLTPEIKLEKKLLAPIAQGEKVGKIIYTIDNEKYSTDLIATHNVEVSKTLILSIQILVIILILFMLYKFLFDYKLNTINKYYK